MRCVYVVWCVRCVCLSVCVRAWVHVRARARVRVRVCVGACVRACVCMQISGMWYSLPRSGDMNPLKKNHPAGLWTKFQGLQVGFMFGDSFFDGDLQ